MYNCRLPTWADRFKELGAYWLHDGNPVRPHALLSSGNHSNGFFNGSLVIESPSLLNLAVADLKKLLDIWQDLRGRVFGSALGAVDLSYELGRQLGCLRGFTEPAVVDGENVMILKRFNFEPGTKILVCEDVLTTGGTTRKTIAALEAAGADLMPMIAVLVNRSGMSHLDGRHIVGLVNQPMPIWTPDECPLCKEGSEAIRPKSKENWERLTAEY